MCVSKNSNIEPRHDISNNAVCVPSKASDQICAVWSEPLFSHGYSMIVKLPTEYRLEFLSSKGGCKSSSESTHVIMPHCWKSHVAAYMWHMLPLALLNLNSSTFKKNNVDPDQMAPSDQDSHRFHSDLKKIMLTTGMQRVNSLKMWATFGT